jgi:hypothetical protein
LRRGLKADPKERFSSMQELLDKLMSDAVLVEPVRPTAGRRPWIIAASLAVLVVGALAVMSAPSPHGKAPVATSAAPVAPSSTVIAEQPAVTEAPEAPTITPPAPAATATPTRRARPVHTQEPKARRPPPPPGRERYVDGLKDPF